MLDWLPVYDPFAAAGMCIRELVQHDPDLDKLGHRWALGQHWARSSSTTRDLDKLGHHWALGQHDP